MLKMLRYSTVENVCVLVVWILRLAERLPSVQI